MARVHMVQGRMFLVHRFGIFQLYVQSVTGETGTEWKNTAELSAAGCCIYGATTGYVQL